MRRCKRCNRPIKKKRITVCLKCKAKEKERKCKRCGGTITKKRITVCLECKEKERLASLTYCVCGAVMSGKSKVCDTCCSEIAFDSLVAAYEANRWRFQKHEAYLIRWCTQQRNTMGDGSSRKNHKEDLNWSSTKKGKKTKDHVIAMSRLTYMAMKNREMGKIKSHEDFEQFRRDCLILVAIPRDTNNSGLLKKYQSIENKIATAKEYGAGYYDISGPIKHGKRRAVTKKEFIKRFEAVEKWWVQ